MVGGVWAKPRCYANSAQSKKGVYSITDPFLALWFGCIYPYESFLEFADECTFMLFSKSGFSDELRRIADGRQDVELVDDLFA